MSNVPEFYVARFSVKHYNLGKEYIKQIEKINII